MNAYTYVMCQHFSGAMSGGVESGWYLQKARLALCQAHLGRDAADKCICLLVSVLVAGNKHRWDVFAMRLCLRYMSCLTVHTCLTVLRVALQALPNKRVLVVAHENITNNYYAGNNRSCLVSNCLFRVGGAACMLSNKCAAPHDVCRWGRKCRT